PFPCSGGACCASMVGIERPRAPHHPRHHPARASPTPVITCHPESPAVSRGGEGSVFSLLLFLSRFFLPALPLAPFGMTAAAVLRFSSSEVGARSFVPSCWFSLTLRG